MARSKRKVLKRRTKKNNKKTLITTVIIIGLVLVIAYLFLNSSSLNNSLNKTGLSKGNNALTKLMGNIQEKWSQLDITNVSIDEKIRLGSDKSTDTDGDGISDIDEKEGTLGYVTDPLKADTDGDGLSDLREYWWATDPTKADTNGDFISDGDSVNNRETYPYILGRTAGSTLGSLDIDGDGLPTATEKYELGSDYKSFSTDGDRYGDGQEYFGLDTKNEALPSYVDANMFVPAVPDVGIRVLPKIKLNLAQSVKIGSDSIKKGEHEYKTEKESTQTTTFSTGTKATVSASIGMPPWDSKVETTVEGYVGIDYSSSSRMSKMVTNTKSSTEQIYSSKEVDLAGSTIQIWLDIVNKGTDIMSSPLKEVTLNFYMGNDSLPFYTKTIKNELTNLKPNEKLTISVDSIPLNFNLYQRLYAGETIEVRIPHYSFGKDQLYLETAKANSVQIDVVNETDTKTFYVIPRKKDSNLTEILDLGNINYTVKDGTITQVNNKFVHSGSIPYKWFKLLVTKKDGKEDATIKNINDIVLNKGDHVLFKQYVDNDGDLLSNEEEVKLGTDPNNVDTDGDGLEDGPSIPEKNVLGEVSYGTNPLAVDSDGDGFSDFIEVIGGSDPTNHSDIPKLPVVFKHKDYRGTARVLNETALSLGELEHEISSIYVPKGKAIIYYFAPKLQGEGKLLLDSTSYLGDDNDKIVSLKVINITDLPDVKIKMHRKNTCIYSDIKKNDFLYTFTNIYERSYINPGLRISNCDSNANNLLWRLDFKGDNTVNLISLENPKDDSVCLFRTDENAGSNQKVPYLDKCDNTKYTPWNIDLVHPSSARYRIFDKKKVYGRTVDYYLMESYQQSSLLGIGTDKGITWNFIVPENPIPMDGS